MEKNKKNLPKEGNTEHTRNEQNERENINNPAEGHQGRASHITGSTTQGGSNFGQGSSQLGGDAYRQGDTSNTGSNYENEQGRLGSSNIGTNSEGVASQQAGTEKGGGAGGYDAGREKQEIQQEQEEMHNERDLDRLQVDEEPNKESPEQPQRENDGNRPNDVSEGRSTGAWSKSSWDQNNSPR